MSGLTRTQVKRLLRGIDAAHVESKRGMSYMAQHEVRAELTRIFGVGNWDSKVESMEKLWEQEIPPGSPDYGEKWNGKTSYWRACYKAAVRLTIRDYWGNEVCSFVEHHVEANSALPDRGEAEAMAVTSVESYALRRAAIGLGDRLGLGLYDGGKQTPLVKGSLQLTDKESPLYEEPAPTPAGEGEPERVLSQTGAERLQAIVNVASPERQGPGAYSR